MGRIYRERKYLCGEYMEVQTYPVYTKRKSRGAKRKPTSAVQMKLNKTHAEGKLRRLLHTNFKETDLFVTLTYDSAHLPPRVEVAQKHLQNFFRRLKRLYVKKGLELKYVAVIEYGSTGGRIHIHLVMNDGTTAPEQEKLWGMGTVRCSLLKFASDGLTGLAAYLTKDPTASGGRATYKRWSASRNLEKPVVVERDGRLSHRKMVDICKDGGDGNYMETEYCGYRLVSGMDIMEDMYGGYYLGALMKKIPPSAIARVAKIWAPISRTLDLDPASGADASCPLRW